MFRIITLLLFIFSSSTAFAGTPKVTLRLAAEQMATVHGRTTLSPVGSRVLKAGDLLIYRLTAHNSGTSAALALEPIGKIPPRTAFVRVLQAPPNATAAFTLDGVHFSEHPTVTVKGADGKPVTKPAPLGAYRAVRWHLATPLKPSASATFLYEVRVQ